MRTFALSVLWLALPLLGLAQQPAQGPLTLSSAVDLALHEHPAVRQAQAGSSAATGEIAVARTAYLPRIDLLWQANRATRNNVFGLLLPQMVVPPVSGPVLAAESGAGVWNSAGGLLASWEPVDFGRRQAGVDFARSGSAVAAAERRLTELSVAATAADAYLAVLAADAALAATRANEQRLSVFGDAVRTLVRNQLRAGVEQSRADAELAAARNRVAEAARDAALARIALTDAIGRPGTTVELDSRALLQPPPQPSAPAFDPASHPSAVAADAEVQAAQAHDRLLRTSYAPQVQLQGAFSGRGVSRAIDGSDNGNALGLRTTNWAVGVSVTFPVLDGVRTQAQRRVQAGRIQEASAQYARTVQTLQSDEARARAITAAALQVAANSPQQLQAARETATQLRVRYDAGLATIVDVADAARLLADAEIGSAVAVLAVWRAWLAEAVLRDDLQAFLTRLPAARTP